MQSLISALKNVVRSPQHQFNIRKRNNIAAAFTAVSITFTVVNTLLNVNDV